jgi:hypothetical protein
MQTFLLVGLCVGGVLGFCGVYFWLDRHRNTLPKWISNWMIWPALFDQVGKLPSKEQNKVGYRVAVGFGIMILLVILGHLINGSGRN